MKKLIHNMKDLNLILNPIISIVIENSCNRLLGSLQTIIDEEFYDIFDPLKYVRTDQFWKSAMSEMVSQCCGHVFMDESSMNYGSYWSGKRQILEASIGSHGGIITNVTEKHRFWDVFIKFCENNVNQILKEEFFKQGIRLK